MRFAPTWTSSASMGPRRRRSRARSARRSAPPAAARRPRRGGRRRRGRRGRPRAPEAEPEPRAEPEAPEPEPVAAEEPAAPVEADELPDDAALEPEADHPEPIEDPEPVVRSGDTPPRGTPAVEEPPRRRGRRERGCARGDAGVPPGDARARPALVRAEAPARLRLRRGIDPPRRRAHDVPLDACMTPGLGAQAHPGHTPSRGPTTVRRVPSASRRHGTPLRLERGSPGRAVPVSICDAAQAM